MTPETLHAIEQTFVLVLWLSGIFTAMGICGAVYGALRGRKED